SSSIFTSEGVDIATSQNPVWVAHRSSRGSADARASQVRRSERGTGSPSHSTKSARGRDRTAREVQDRNSRSGPQVAEATLDRFRTLCLSATWTAYLLALPAQAQVPAIQQPPQATDRPGSFEYNDPARKMTARVQLPNSLGRWNVENPWRE